MKNLPKTAEELDRRFDEGEDLESLGFDLSKATQTGLEIQRVNVDFPKHFLQKLDREAELRGVSRQALIKMWLYERLQLAIAGNVYRPLPLTEQPTFSGGGEIVEVLAPRSSGVCEAAPAKSLSGTGSITRSK